MGRIPSKPWCREVSKGVTIIQGDNLISVDTPKDGDIKPVPKSPRKEKIVKDTVLFQRVDRMASKIPKSAETSVSDLAKYITMCSKTDIGRARAIFYWICHNIEFDTKAYLKRTKRPMSAEFVLQTKLTVCYGYCDLFVQLCRLCNIPARTIHGFGKGFGYNPTKPFKYYQSTNHAWNAVNLSGQWCLVDCTWGTGYLDDTRHYNKVFEQFYFLTKPEEFINSHFPYVNRDVEESKSWQLLSNPLDLETFARLVKKSVNLLQWGIELVSHENAVIPIHYSENFIIRATAKSLHNVTARLTASNGTVYRQFTMVQQTNIDTYEVIVRPPFTGKYALSLSASVNTKEKNASSFVTYLIRCKNAEKERHPFPNHHGIWKSHIDYRKYGFASGADVPRVICPERGYLDLLLKTKKEIQISSDLTYAMENIPNLDQYVLTENFPTSVHIRANLPRKGFYKLQVCCKNSDGIFEPVLLYLIDCTKDCNTSAYPFPIIYSSANKFHCELVEPLRRFLPSATHVRIQFNSNKLVKAVVNGHKIEKSECGIWETVIKTPGPGNTIRIAGTNELKGRYWVLYEYEIVKKPMLDANKTFIIHV